MGNRPIGSLEANLGLASCLSPSLGQEGSVELWFGSGRPSMGKGEFTGRLQVTGKDNKLI